VLVVNVKARRPFVVGRSQTKIEAWASTGALVAKAPKAVGPEEAVD